MKPSSHLSLHARQRLALRTSLTPEWVDAALRQGKTVIFRFAFGGRMRYHLLYSPDEDKYYVLPDDVHRGRVCTVLPLEMYLPRALPGTLTEKDFFYAKSCFRSPGCKVSPVTGAPMRVRLVAYFLDDRNTLRAMSMGMIDYPAEVGQLFELGGRKELVAGLLARVRAKGINPERVASLYGEQSKKVGPVLLKAFTPNPWAPAFLEQAPTPELLAEAVA